MTPKQKAKELFDRFDLPTGLMSKEIKQCALICVDEIMKSHDRGLGTPLYWEQVKQEIEKL